MRLPLLFLLCALPLGFVLARLVPVGEVPDETAHIFRAYALSTGQWIGRRAPPNPGSTVVRSGYDVDTGLVGASLPSPEPGGLVTDAVAARRRTAVWTHETLFASVPNTTTYAPVFYVLSAASLGGGRWLGAGPEASIAAARMANLLGFVALGAGAVAAARRARYVLFALLCLPSSLSLAASVNQDGLLIAVSVLGVALVTRPDPVSRRWAALAFAAVGMAKPPYLPLVALLLTPPAGRRGWNGLGLAVLAALPGLLWSLAAMHWATVPFDTPPYLPGPLYTGDVATFTATDAAAQAAILRAHPSLLLSLVADTIQAQWRTWRTEVVGVLGALSLVLPVWLYRLWDAALLCTVLGEVLAPRMSGAAAWSRVGVALAAGAALLSAYLVFIVEYLIWTHVGETIVDGIQGRYFVPLLASCALALPRLGVLRGWPARAWLVPVLGASVAQFVAIPALVVWRWYLH